jgi:hypothetical protein
MSMLCDTFLLDLFLIIAGIAMDSNLQDVYAWVHLFIDLGSIFYLCIFHCLYSDYCTLFVELTYINRPTVRSRRLFLVS